MTGYNNLYYILFLKYFGDDADIEVMETVNGCYY